MYIVSTTYAVNPGDGGWSNKLPGRLSSLAASQINSYAIAHTQCTTFYLRHTAPSQRVGAAASVRRDKETSSFVPVVDPCLPTCSNLTFPQQPGSTTKPSTQSPQVRDRRQPGYTPVFRHSSRNCMGSSSHCSNTARPPSILPREMDTASCLV